MRVDHLFIIGIVADKPAGPAERFNVDVTLKQLKILAAKHRHKCRYVTSYVVKYSSGFRSFIDPVDMNTWSDAPALMGAYDPGGLSVGVQDMTAPPSALVPYAFSPDEIEPDSPQRVGVYLIGNLDRREFVLEALTIEPVAGLLKQKLGFRKIDKLCLVACGGARRGSKSKENRLPKDINERTDLKTQNANEKCYLYALCRRLAAAPNPLRPMIAGWDGFVEVAGASDDIDKSVKGGVSPEQAGKKIFEPGKGGMREFARPGGDPHPRLGTHKRVISFTGGKAVWHLEMAGWSDRL